MIYKYLDIYSQLIKNSDFRKIFEGYELNDISSKIDFLNNLKNINKKNLSLSDLESFLTQNYMAKNSKKLLGYDLDFFLTSEYKNLFFDYFDLNKDLQLEKIKISDTPCNFDFLENVASLEKELNFLKTNPKVKKQLHAILSQIILSFNYTEKFEDFREAALFLKKTLLNSKDAEELFLDKNNYLGCISALNNSLRREMLGIVYENKRIKAEAIRAKINKIHSKKYTLTSVLKNLNILARAKILKKKNRFYELTYQRIIMNIHMGWLCEPQKFQAAKTN